MYDIESIPLALTYADVLLQPAYSEVLPRQTHPATSLGPRLRLPLPILASAMDSVTESAMAVALAQLGALGVVHKNCLPAEQAAMVAAVKATPPREPTTAALDSEGRLLCAAAVGVGADLEARLQVLVDAGIDALVVDTAHGHSAGVLRAVETAKKRHPQLTIVGGNVATPGAVVALASAGVDVVKVGIGPGSICTTRIVAGVGVPQFSAVQVCARAAKACSVALIADGGIAESGDIVKALAAGADAVMIGSLLAGTDEAPGHLVNRAGRSYKTVRGMGSLAAMKQGSRDRYFQTDTGDDKLVAEGVEGLILSRGPVAGVIHQLAGGLRAGMGYLGAATLADLRRNARFVRITPAGRRESEVHDILRESTGSP